MTSRLSRREFLKSLMVVGGATAVSPLLEACGKKTTGFESDLSTPTLQPSSTSVPEIPTMSPPTETSEPVLSPSVTEPVHAPTTPIALVMTRDRGSGINQALDLLDFHLEKGSNLFLKPNFNSADPTPGSTHNDSLLALIRRFKARGVQHITVGDRSGMGDTRSVFRQKGIFQLAEELGISTLVLDELEARDWELIRLPGSYWRNGFPFARPVLQADRVVQTCCLKTHRYGGHFTLSLKNSVGLVAKTVPGEGHDYMRELHSSKHQRLMIAEINAAYEPDIVILDGIDAFVTGGPARGKLVSPQVILAGTDRVALDAVGVAILRLYGTTPEVDNGSIFNQEQIAHAVQLGLGVDRPDQIEFITADRNSASFAEQIRETLLQT